ncbi:MAG: tetratricopeptide repeat protein [Planctomycetes bacterium]|nr:tetratricopeptide repeat protein [Planctomycetota bacterium]
MGPLLHSWILASVLAWFALLPQTPPQPLPQPTAADEVSLGQQLFAAARYEEAEPHFLAATRLAPNDAGAWNALGTARHAQKRWPAAIEAFDRARALVPNEPQLLVNLAICRFELHELEPSAALFTRALELAPAESRAHLFLARIAVLLGDDARAEREFAAATKAAAPDPLALLHQGIFFLQAKRLDEARQVLERLVVLDPNLPGGWLNLGLVLQKQGKKDEARPHLARFRELSELLVGEERLRMRVTALLKASNTDLEGGRLDAALKSALAARDLAPEAPIVHQFLAHIYQLQGRRADSQAAANKAKELENAANGGSAPR